MRLVALLCLLLACPGLQAQTPITKQQAWEDIDTLVAVTESVHYNPYRYISKEAFRQKADSIKSTLPDSIDTRAFVLKLFTLTAALEDGHASPAFSQPALRTAFAQKNFLPLALVGDEQDHVYIRDTAAAGLGLPKGARILKINGVDIQQFKRKATGLVGGLLPYKRELSSRLFSYYLFIAGVQPPFAITYTQGDGTQKEVVVPEGLDFVSSVTRSLPSLSLPPYSFKIIDGKVGYIDFVSMNGAFTPFMQFLDSAFRVMRTQNIQTLAVDLRKNTGGDSRFGDILLGFITSNNFALSGRKNWKISPQYKAYLRSRGDTASAYLAQPDGSVWQLGQCGPREKLVTVDTVFTGKVYLLTGPLTFSSANMLADGAKHYGLATLVGEPTGESTNDFGEVYSFTLPHSKVRVNTTTSFDVGADCNEAHNDPVAPHHLVTTTVQDLLNDRDPVLEWVMRVSDEE